MNKEDLGIYLDMLQKRIDSYKAENLVRPDTYLKIQIKKLDQMAIEAIARFHKGA